MISRRARTFAMSAALALAVTTAAPASATTDPRTRRNRVNQQITVAQAALADLSTKAKTAFLALRKTQLAIPAAQARLNAAQARIVAAEARKQQIEADLVEAKADEAAGQVRLAINAAQTRTAEDRRNDLARAAYEGGGSERFSVLLDSDSARDLSERLYLVERVSDRQQTVLTDLKDARLQGQVEQSLLEAATRRVAQLNLQAKANLLEAQSAATDAAAAKAQLVTLASSQKRQLAAVAAQRAAEKRRVDELQKESDAITALLRARSHSGSNTPPADAGGTLAYPVSGPITSEFGMRYHPILHYYRLHAGMDFGVPCGTPVHAAANGVIVSAGWGGGYGNRIIIAHAGPLATTYNHLKSIRVHSGSVSRGELIGYSGTTGLSTGCHLHFEVRVNGTPVNPRIYL
jgi:murein DD-endopeptidase MepM/ murein hydrolase activator NlpD